jgi:hypothetical protein
VPQLVLDVQSQAMLVVLHVLPEEQVAAVVQGPPHSPVAVLHESAPHTSAGFSAQFGKHTPSELSLVTLSQM